MLFGMLFSVLAWALPPAFEEEAPQVRALLEQAWTFESGAGVLPNRLLAASLYQQAGQLGSAEGYFRAAVLVASAKGAWGGADAACLFSTASQLGHRLATLMIEQYALQSGAQCEEDLVRVLSYRGFDLDGYVTALPVPKKKIVAMIRRLAPAYAVDVRLALAVASVESNFNHFALSPKNAMGVMQLIPETAERFNVRKPFDPEQNIRGGLAYLRWLGRYYRGDLLRVVAAYNAGEKAVDNYGGVPPYRETMAYVSRVLGFSGVDVAVALPATGAGKR